MRAWLIPLVVCVGCGEDAPGTLDAPGSGDAAVCETKAPWASAPPLMLGATQETAAVAIGDKVYILGGFNSNDGIVPAVQIFDTASCTYSLGPPMPKPVHHINAVALDGTIYVLGSMETAAFTAIGDTWSWNPADADWTVRAAMPAGTQRGSAIVGAIAGKIYVAGGLRNGAVTDVSVYDPVMDSWTAETPLPQTRDHACGGALDGKLYVIGGRQANITTITGLVYEFTPGGAWVERLAMPTPRGGTGCGAVGDRFVVVGGEGNPGTASGVFSEVEAYTPATNTWETLAPMPTPRHGMGAATVGTRLYVPGGATRQGFGAVATHEILTP